MRTTMVLVLVWSSTHPLTASCQELPGLLPDINQQPILPRNLDWQFGANSLEKSEAKSWNRIRLFGMPTGYLMDPVGLDFEDENGSAFDPNPAAPISQDYGDDGRMGIALGADNPFLDIHFPGDPGGVGYYQINTQYQLFNNEFTFLNMGIQAFTPAGLENAGIAKGPTVFRPTFACTQEFLWGTAIHGFVGRPVSARAGWTSNWERGVHYGLAFQSPTLWSSACSGRCLHMFVEALGTFHRTPQAAAVLPPSWEIIPGLHWKLGDNWWMSSGIILPLKTYTNDPALLQFTCSFRF